MSLFDDEVQYVHISCEILGKTAMRFKAIIMKRTCKMLTIR